ncbi:MAG: ABC transporter permease [Pseudomonadota bacterium]
MSEASSLSQPQAQDICAICLIVRRVFDAVAPIGTVLGVIVLVWYLACIPMNRAWIEDRAGASQTLAELIPAVWQQGSPVLPAPHQVGGALWETTIAEPPLRERRGELRGNPRSLIFHAYQTLAPTLLGFLVGTFAGMALATGIIHSRAMDLSVMPWAIASQMVPILAIAPMVIVVLSSLGVTGLFPKALISSYLSFFPVVVGMVKGLRSPSPMDMDLMRTYSASAAQIFWKLRLPASLPFLFASLKVGIAAALVGAIVAELPTGARFGLGARLLTGSYYSDTLMIWSALFMAAICAALLVGGLGLMERIMLRRMGARA